MNALIIDDEEKARKNLELLLKQFCPDVTVVAATDNINEGENLLKEHHVDVVFLDIEMPKGNGFELLDRFDTYPFEVILITAYDQYALQAIKSRALDYLLKPIDIDELIDAVKKVETSIQANLNEEKAQLAAGVQMDVVREKLVLPMKDGYVFLGFTEIIRIESDGSYTTFFTMNKEKIVVSKHLKEFERLLPPHRFFRCHKSHIINLDCVKKFVRNDGFSVEMSDGAFVEVSRRKKDEFLECMQQ